MAKLPEVALLVDGATAAGRSVARGVICYAREHQMWSLFAPSGWSGEASPRWLSSWRGAVIAQVASSRVAAALAKVSGPAVGIGAARLETNWPVIDADSGAVAAAAIDHLLARGFRQLAFVGSRRLPSSRDLCRAMSEVARLHQAPLDTLELVEPRRAAPGGWRQRQRQLVEWLEKLPKPCGVVAHNDGHARQVIDACRLAEIDVPSQIAVVGVGNDEHLCEVDDPRLSSVSIDYARIGYLAAESLEMLMMRVEIDRAPRLVEPLGVIARESSDVVAVIDHDVSAALRFIRSHACDGIKVEDVLRVVPLSRRVLEQRFKKAVGITLHDEIMRVKMRWVKQLLEETDLPLSVIANRAGFKHAEYLSVVFKQHFGHSASQCRASHRAGAVAGEP